MTTISVVVTHFFQLGYSARPLSIGTRPNEHKNTLFRGPDYATGLQLLMPYYRLTLSAK